MSIQPCFRWNEFCVLHSSVQLHFLLMLRDPISSLPELFGTRLQWLPVNWPKSSISLIQPLVSLPLVMPDVVTGDLSRLETSWLSDIWIIGFSACGLKVAVVAIKLSPMNSRLTSMPTAASYQRGALLSVSSLAMKDFMKSFIPMNFELTLAVLIRIPRLTRSLLTCVRSSREMSF